MLPTTHSASPWRTDFGAVYDRDGAIVARDARMPEHGTPDRIGHAKRYANLQLCAAAPGMLAMLREIDQAADDAALHASVQKARALLLAISTKMMPPEVP